MKHAVLWASADLAGGSSDWRWLPHSVASLLYWTWRLSVPIQALSHSGATSPWLCEKQGQASKLSHPQKGWCYDGSPVLWLAPLHPCQNRLLGRPVTLLEGWGQWGCFGVISYWRDRDLSRFRARRAILRYFCSEEHSCQCPRESKLVLLLSPGKAACQTNNKQGLPHSLTSFGIWPGKTRSLQISASFAYLQRMARAPVNTDSCSCSPPPITGAAAVGVDDDVFSCNTETQWVPGVQLTKKGNSPKHLLRLH